MEGTWTETGDSENRDDRTESEVGSWSQNRQRDDAHETISESLNRHLNIAGHDPRVQYQQMQEINSEEAAETQTETPSISRWWKHVLGSLLLAPVLFMLTIAGAILYLQFTNQITFVLMTILGLLFLATRLSLPIALYRDITRIHSSSADWNPRKWLYVLGALIVPPPMEFLTASLYLSRRYMFIGSPNLKAAPRLIKDKLQKHISSLNLTN